MLVTGGSRRIGEAIALRFVDARSDPGGDRLPPHDAAAERPQMSCGGRRRAVLVRGNVASSRVGKEVAALGPLDALVHYAATGVIPGRPSIPRTSTWTGPTPPTPGHCSRSPGSRCRRCRPAPRSSASRASARARVLENYALVGTSNGALESLVRYLAIELGSARDPCQRRQRRRRRHRRARALPEPGDDARARCLETPPGRLVSAEDMAGVVTFLCSPEAEMIRGQDRRRRRRLVAAGRMSTGPGFPPALRERLHDLAGQRVLHLGCGTGEATVELASSGGTRHGRGHRPRGARGGPPARPGIAVAPRRRRAPARGAAAGTELLPSSCWSARSPARATSTTGQPGSQPRCVPEAS